MSKQSKSGKAILIRFPADLASWLQEQSQRKGRSMTQIVVAATEAARDQPTLEERSDFERATERFITAVGDKSSEDERWDALLGLLRFFELRPGLKRLIILDDRGLKNEIKSLSAGFRTHLTSAVATTPQAAKKGRQKS
jgi:hypothetical protein